MITPQPWEKPDQSGYDSGPVHGEGGVGAIPRHLPGGSQGRLTAVQQGLAKFWDFIR
jgi:hypothetical protein